MGKPYSSKKSFIGNMIIAYMNLYADFPENDDIFLTFHNELLENLNYIVNNKNDLGFLNYELFSVDDDNDNVKVVAYNLITSLWFIGIIPHDGGLVEKMGKFEYKGKRYTFNEDENELIISNIKNNE